MKESESIPQAKDFMTGQIHWITPGMSLAEIIEFLEKHGISNAPVIELENDRKILVGFVSEGDCLEFLANESFFGSPSPPQTAATIMKRHPVCVAPETELFTLASIFVSHGYRHLPVVADRELLGIVSRRDILKAMNAYYKQLLQEKDRIRHRPDYNDLMQQRFIVSSQ